MGKKAPLPGAGLEPGLVPSCLLLLVPKAADLSELSINKLNCKQISTLTPCPSPAESLTPASFRLALVSSGNIKNLQWGHLQAKAFTPFRARGTLHIHGRSKGYTFHVPSYLQSLPSRKGETSEERLRPACRKPLRRSTGAWIQSVEGGWGSRKLPHSSQDRQAAKVKDSAPMLPYHPSTPAQYPHNHSFLIVMILFVLILSFLCTVSCMREGTCLSYSLLCSQYQA